MDYPNITLRVLSSGQLLAYIDNGPEGLDVEHIDITPTEQVITPNGSYLTHLENAIRF
jgi:hypothetical protein